MHSHLNSSNYNIDDDGNLKCSKKAHRNKKSKGCWSFPFLSGKVF